MLCRRRHEAAQRGVRDGITNLRALAAFGITCRFYAKLIVVQFIRVRGYAEHWGLAINRAVGRFF